MAINFHTLISLASCCLGNHWDFCICTFNFVPSSVSWFSAIRDILRCPPYKGHIIFWKTSYYTYCTDFIYGKTDVIVNIYYKYTQKLYKCNNYKNIHYINSYVILHHKIHPRKKYDILIEAVVILTKGSILCSVRTLLASPLRSYHLKGHHGPFKPYPTMEPQNVNKNLPKACGISSKTCSPCPRPLNWLSVYLRPNSRACMSLFFVFVLQWLQGTQHFAFLMPA